jgi:hypothetical protein
MCPAITFVNGIRVEQLVEHNGMPPSAAQQRKYLEKVKKLKRETVAERTARVRIEEEDNASLIREVPLAFSIVGEDTIDDRPAWCYRQLLTPATTRAENTARCLQT